MTTPTPPVPPPPTPPGFLARLMTRLDAIGGVVTVAGGIGAIVAAGIGTAGGYVQTAYDKITASSQTQNQVSALDERLKLVESEKPKLEKDRTDMARIARDLESTTKDLARTGVDVSALEELQRRLEMKVERLDGILDELRAGRRKGR
ncbi:hypothetical protein [Aureimonas sp. N4]|uniref:hypothetical protein n=1 Tax=Aureimonas sp. N4 TaxID=1638165 RepID=UPI0007866B8C|nr:hypothetical protein [Aureimonas sp. N4]